MSEVVDVIHRLTFEVSGQQEVAKQVNKIDELIAQKERLTQLFNTTQDVNQQQKLSTAILDLDKAIKKQTETSSQYLAQNKNVQQALTVELGLIQKLTDKINDLRQARERQTSATGIKQINIELAAAKKELQALTDEGGKNSILATLFGFGGGAGSVGRQLLTGGLIGVGFGSGIGLVSRAVSGLIEYAEAELDAVGKAEKLASANEGLAKSFEQLADNIDKVNQREKILIEDQIATEQGIDLSVNAYKRKEEAVKALGIVSGEVFEAEKNQLKASQDRRQLELGALNEKKKSLLEIEAIIAVAAEQAGHNPDDRDLQAKGAKDIIGSSILPSEEKDRLNIAIDKALKEKAEVSKILDNELKETTVKRVAVQNEVRNKEAEIQNAEVEFDAKVKDRIYNKEKELAEQIKQQQEAFRQLKEKEDIASVDRIVNDTEAKYKKLVENQKKNAVEAAKTIVKDFTRAVDQNGHEDVNKEFDLNFKKLPKSLQDFYNQLFGIFNLEKSQEIGNQTQEFLKSSSLVALQHSAGASKTQAEIDKGNAAFGLLDYDKLTKALDSEIEARKKAEDVQFANLEAAYVKNGDAVGEIQKQHFEKLKQIELEGYRARLAIASDYFGKLTNQIKAANDLILTQDVVDILTGRNKPFTTKSGRIAKATAKSQILTAKLAIPGLEDALNKSREEAVNADTTDKTDVASAQALKDSQKLEDAKKQEAEGEKALHDLKIKQQVDEINLFKDFVDTTVQGYEAIAHAREKDFDREVAIREHRVDLAYKLAERGNTQALKQEEDALEKANKLRREAALRDQAINAALTVSNSILAVAKAAAEGGPFSFLTIAATIAALGVGISQVVALSESSKQSFATGGFTGEGGKYQPAGTVHKGEFVMNKENTDKFRPYLETMHKGFDPFNHTAITSTYNAHGQFATKQDLQDVKDGLKEVVEAIGTISSIKINQSMDKRGVAQSVEQEIRAQRMKWR